MPCLALAVSVLFSEPKISQSDAGSVKSYNRRSRFSALQRAENFSIILCSLYPLYHRRFSALQRAENFSINSNDDRAGACDEFQCSSASRKFLNRVDAHPFPAQR